MICSLEKVVKETTDEYELLVGEIEQLKLKADKDASFTEYQ